MPKDLSLRDAHGTIKEWFLVLEEDAVLSASAGLAAEGLFGSLTKLLGQLPKRAQALNLG